MKYFIFFSFIVGTSFGFAEPSDAEKCADTVYVNEASEYFMCDVSWGLDSCEGLSTRSKTEAGVLVGGAVGTLRSNLKNAKAKNAFDEYLRLQKIHEDNIINQHEAGKKAVKAGLESREMAEYRKAKATTDKFYDEVLAPHMKKWSLTWEAKGRSHGFRESFRDLTNAQERHIKDNKALSDAKPSQVAEASHDALVSEKIVQDREARLKKFFNKEFMRPRGGVAGAIAGGSIGAYPWIRNYVGNKTCSNLKEQQGLHEYADIGFFEDTCGVGVDDDQELKLLKMTAKERLSLFQKYPALCEAFVKKTEERQARIKRLDIKPELTECTANGAKVSVEIRGHAYDYTIKNTADGMEISAPLGTGGTLPDHPMTVGWTYNPDQMKFSTTKLKPTTAWPQLGTPKDLDYFRQSSLPLDDKFTPLQHKSDSPEGIVQMTSEDPKNIVGTISEQAMAIKAALPQALRACGFIQSVAADSSPRPKSEKKSVEKN